MIAIPFPINSREYNLFIGLDDENIGRIRGHDPAEFVTDKLAPHLKSLRLNTVIVGYANAEDIARVKEILDGDKGFRSYREAVEFLSRFQTEVWPVGIHFYGLEGESPEGLAQ
jgi:hypothetical protein